jgi:hypothetical protein
MATVVLLLALLLLGPAALFLGADSRERDTRCRQSWWPGERGERKRSL